MCEPENWLSTQIREYEKEEAAAPTHFPKRSDGSMYEIHDLERDQQQISGAIFEKLREWVECADYSTFKPLRMIVNGAGGSGKSVLLNTSITAIRRMFDSNNVARVVAPTGASAANVKGPTLHSLFTISTSSNDYKPGSMTSQQKKDMVKKFGVLLALICDERSLLSSRVLGTAEQKLQETIYNGFLSHIEWGGLPILILIGDDFQLPPVEEGALSALCRVDGGAMVRKGRATFKKCAKYVTELLGNKRVGNRVHDRELLQRLRLGDENLLDEDVNRLLNLHIDTYKKSMEKRKHRKLETSQYISSFEMNQG